VLEFHRILLKTSGVAVAIFVMICFKNAQFKVNSNVDKLSFLEIEGNDKQM
jgi:hypothetical protein